MALNYKTPEEIAQQYLTYLKGLKPEVNIKQKDSDWWVRGHVVGGVISGIYADQQKIADDIFPQSARREALEKHLNLYFNEGFKAATEAEGYLLLTGASGSVVPAGTQFEYTENGNLYSSTDEVDFGTATTGLVAVTSVIAGQDQNLLEGAELTVQSPPAGIDSIATVTDGNLSNGRNEETNEEASARILTQIRTPLAGGKVSDYQQFALDADTSVVSASIIRYPFGFGTVGIVITAGTSDIDTALDAGDPIVLIPSDALIATVQEYIEEQCPVTDCPTVMAPASAGIDVTVKVRFASGDKDTILSGETLTQGELVEREVKRAIYKLPAGGRKFGASGYVLASEIEEMIDFNLSASPITVGEKLEIVVDRQVNDLSASGANRTILPTEIALPGTITIEEF